MSAAGGPQYKIQRVRVYIYTRQRSGDVSKRAPKQIKCDVQTVKPRRKFPDTCLIFHRQFLERHPSMLICDMS